MKLLILILFFSFQVKANELDNLYKARRFADIVKQYNTAEKVEKLTARDTLIVSYSYKALGKYREDAKIIAALIKRIHAIDHKKIYTLIQEKETIESDEYSNSLKMLYWNIYNSYGQILLSYKKRNAQFEKDYQIFQTFRTILSELEFREGKVEKLNDKVMTQDQYLKDLEYHFVRNISLTYLSWQVSANLVRTTNNHQTKLLVTNQGPCVGGDIGYENGFNHFSLDGCFFYGSGTANSIDSNVVNYKQTIAAYGLKFGPSYSRIISSSKTRFGTAVSLVFNTQSFTDPDDPEYKIDKKSSLSIYPAIFARWQFGQWFFKSEFGGFIGQNEVIWGLGIGHSF